jgi:hypothetical protein
VRLFSPYIALGCSQRFQKLHGKGDPRRRDDEYFYLFIPNFKFRISRLFGTYLAVSVMFGDKVAPMGGFCTQSLANKPQKAQHEAGPDAVMVDPCRRNVRLIAVRAPGARGAVIPLPHGITARNRLSEHGPESGRSERPAPAPKRGPESRAPPGPRPNSRIGRWSRRPSMSSNGGLAEPLYRFHTVLWRGTGYQSADLSLDDPISRPQRQNEGQESEKLIA